MNFESDLPIIVVFPPYAGGKFVMNCLNLSQHVAPSHRGLISQLLPQLDNYKLRLSAVMSTLPRPDDMLEWQNFEFQDEDLFKGSQNYNPTSDLMWSGRMARDWINGTSDPGTDEFLTSIMSKNLHWFMTVHDQTTKVIANVCQPWPRARIVLLINHEKFWQVAVDNKTNNQLDRVLVAGNFCQKKYNQLRGEDWPSWQLVEQHNYNIPNLCKTLQLSNSICEEMMQYYDWHVISNPVYTYNVDESYFDTSQVIEHMADLYKWIGLDDFQPDLIKTYHTAYIKLHQS